MRIAHLAQCFHRFQSSALAAVHLPVTPFVWEGLGSVKESSGAEVATLSPWLPRLTKGRASGARDINLQGCAPVAPPVHAAQS